MSAERDARMAELLAISFVAQLGDAVTAADEAEAMMMTAVDLFAAHAIMALEQLTGLPRAVALAKHRDSVERVLKAYPR